MQLLRDKIANCDTFGIFFPAPTGCLIMSQCQNHRVQSNSYYQGCHFFYMCGHVQLIKFVIRPKKKSCLVVLHCQPLIFEMWKKVFSVQKYTTPNFQNSKNSFFFLWKFWSFKNNFQIVVVNLLTFLYWFKTCINGFFGIVDLFAPFWEI